MSLSKSSTEHIESRKSHSTRSSGRVPSPHDAATRIQECVVNLHSLATYNADELTPNELKFLQKAKHNLATMHRRLTGITN